jgi:predicted ATPase
MYISSVSLQNWKNFKSAHAALRRRVFLIGPNASGKSNLLDAFRFLRDVAQIGLRSAVLDKRDSVSALRCLAARESPGIGIDDSDRAAWRYRLEFNQDTSRQPVIRKEVVTDLTCDRTILARPDSDDLADPPRLTQTALEQINANQSFRPVAEFLASISYQHVVPQVVRDPKGFSPGPVLDDPFGRDLLMRIWTTNEKTRDARLRRISMVLKRAVPQLTSLAVEMDQRGTPHLVGRYEHWRAHGARQNEGQFSDGTLRLFGLMWSMFDGIGPLLLEEPEISLHPEIVRQLPQMLVQLQAEIRRMKRKGTHVRRQVIVSTHSEELLSDIGIAPEEVIRIEPSGEGSLLCVPTDQDRELLRSGLSVAEVLLPKSSPQSMQLLLDLPGMK